MLLAVHFVKLVTGPVFAHLERTAGKHVKEKVQGGFPCDCIHLVFKDARKAPVFGGFGSHLYLSGNTVRDVTDELD